MGKARQLEVLTAAATTAAAAPPPASGGDGPFSVKDFGALGNGIADDTKAIERAINATNAAKSSRAYGCGQGCGLTAPELLFPAGTYRISETLHVGYSFHFLPCLRPPAMPARHPTPSVRLHLDIVQCGSRWLG